MSPRNDRAEPQALLDGGDDMTTMEIASHALLIDGKRTQPPDDFERIRARALARG
jgi:hypothetical protein